MGQQDNHWRGVTNTTASLRNTGFVIARLFDIGKDCWQPDSINTMLTGMTEKQQLHYLIRMYSSYIIFMF